MVPAREWVDAVDTPGCVVLAVVLVVLTSEPEGHPFCMSKLVRVRGVRLFPPWYTTVRLWEPYGRAGVAKNTWLKSVDEFVGRPGRTKATGDRSSTVYKAGAGPWGSSVGINPTQLKPIPERRLDWATKDNHTANPWTGDSSLHHWCLSCSLCRPEATSLDCNV